MSENQGGISMRFVQRMVMHTESSVCVVCGCGQQCGPYYGLHATEKARDFMDTHDCPLRPEQRTGDEPV